MARRSTNSEQTIPRELLIPIVELKKGLVQNIPESLTPGNALIDCNNIEFFKGNLQLVGGWVPYEGMSPITGFSGPIVLIDSFPLTTGSSIGIAGTATHLYQRTGVKTWVSITPGTPFNGDSGLRWNVGVYRDNMIFCLRGVATQVWNGSNPTTSDLVSSTTQALSVLIFADRPILMNMVIGGTPYPQRLRYPDSGTINSWTPAEGSEAGWLDLDESADWVLCGVPMGSFGVIYKERSIHMISYIGYPFVFADRSVVSGIGVMGPNAVADLGDEHQIFGNDNFYMFDGIKITPCGDEVIQEIMETMDPARTWEVENFVLEEKRQVLWKIPLVIGGYKIYIYHYGMDGNVWTKRDLPLYCLGYGIQVNTIRWSDFTYSWAEATWRWGDRALMALYPKNLFGGNDGIIYEFGDAGSANGVAIEGFMTFGGVGGFLSSPEIAAYMKELDYVMPLCPKGNSAHKLRISIRSEGRPGIGFQDITYGDMILDGTGDPLLNFRVPGVNFSIKFSTTTPAVIGNLWKLSGYMVHIKLRGDRL